MKKWIATVVFLALLTGSPAWAAPNWVAPVDTVSEGNVGVSIAENTENQAVSRRFLHIEAQNGFSEYVCLQGVTESGTCDARRPGANFDSTSLLPYCAAVTDMDCIEGMNLGQAGNALKPVPFLRQANGQTFPALTGQGGLPTGSTTSVFEQSSTEGSQQYAVQVIQRNTYSVDSGTYGVQSVSASIFPIILKAKAGVHAPAITQQFRDDGRAFVGGSGNPGDCAFTEENICAEVQDFSMDARFSLTLRLSNQVAGWFKGRIDKPQISITKLNPDHNLVTIEASPVSVARLFTSAPASSLSLAQSDLIKGSMQSGYVHQTHPDLENSLKWVEAFREMAHDSSAANSTLWSFATLDSGFASGNKCLVDNSRVIGSVTTNATAMSYGLPTFQDGFLTYTVAGLHYASDRKTLNEGAYDLVLRSDVARCLYGFSSAPVSATVSVIDDQGQAKVAVTSVNEKDGWIYLSAHGFTFSSPKVQVKLTQAAPEPTPTASPEPTATPSATAKPTVTQPPKTKTTITCVKGKLTKKVTAVAPKCPAGYKKKG